MNFFNIGTGEFLLVLVMALVIFGPQRLPEVARRAGKAVRDLRDMVTNLDPELLQDWREITQDLDSVRDEVKSMRSDLVGIQQDLKSAAKDVGASVDEAVKDATDTVNEVIKDKPGARPAKAASSIAPAQGPASAVSATAAKPASAASRSSASTAARPAASAPAPSTAAKPVATASTAPASPTTKLSTGTPTYKKSGIADSKDEIVGMPLTRNKEGQWEVLDEVVGQKLFPVWKKAPQAAEAGNGHRVALEHVRPQARMARLAAPKVVERRPPAVSRPTLPHRSSRPTASARPGRTRRG